jgi:Golgi nucleoside diphosphatase
MITISGLSSLADDPEGVARYLAPLLDHARSHVPPSLQPETPLFLLATAGMRLLPPAKQAEVLQETCKFLRFHSNFRIDDLSHSGPCGSSVRIITGEEEGLFGWIAVNYLMDGFTGSTNNRTTYGFLDMGGASTQIAFEPSEITKEDSKNLLNVRLRRLGGEEIHHKVFVTTWLGYGTNQARRRYVAQAIVEHEQTRSPHRSSTEEEIILDPCLPKGLKLTESPMHMSPASPHNSQPHNLFGTGSFEQCLQKTSPLLNKDTPCPDTPCLFNGVHVPPIDFSVSHFIGVSEYWYSSEHIFGLGGPYDFVQYERAASEFCARDWAGLVKQHETYREQGRLGGDGEVEESGKVVGTGKWSHQVELSRLEMQCFKAAWVANVLHEGIGMPRIVDPGGNVTTEGGKVAEQAESKGLGRPTFQSLDTVGDIAISWTLGKMVLEASKEVPLLKKTDHPLLDPLDDIPPSADSPYKPIRPPFLDLGAFEDRISRHLPSSLSRVSLGFSPIFFVLCAMLFCVVTFFTYRLRHYLRRSCRLKRGPCKRDSDITSRAYILEESAPLNDNPITSRSGSPPFPTRKKILSSVRRLLPSSRPLPPIAAAQKTPMRLAHAIPTRASPTRSYSAPTIQYQNGLTHIVMPGAPQYGSRSSSSSPSPSPREENFIPNGLPSLTSRSRNSSQVNLTSLVPRQATSISRVNSNACVPGLSSRDE